MAAPASGLTVDAQGNAYFTGEADVKAFKPTINTFPTEDPVEFSPTNDVFLLKLSADGSSLVFSTLFGGYGTDGGSSIALGADGSIYIGGASRTTTGFEPFTSFQPAWVWDPGTFGRSWEITPLLIDGLLIVSEPGTTDVVALEPESGKEIWRHKAPAGKVGRLDRRGFAYWPGDGTMKPRIVVLSVHNMYPGSQDRAVNQ